MNGGSLPPEVFASVQGDAISHLDEGAKLFKSWPIAEKVLRERIMNPGNEADAGSKGV
jgi:hypothetical protein